MEYKRNKKMFNLKQRYKITTTLQEIKRKFEEDKDPSINKTIWKKLIHPFTKKEYIQPTMWAVYIDLKDENCDTKVFKSATKFDSRCLEKLNKGDFDIEENRSRDKFLLLGFGKTKRVAEVRLALFDFLSMFAHPLKDVY